MTPDQFETARGLSGVMLRNLAKSHEAAKEALAKGDAAKAYEIAEKTSDSGRWREFVLAGSAWVQGQWLRSINHIALSESLPVRNKADQHYGQLLNVMRQAYGQQAAGIAHREPRPTLSVCVIVRDEAQHLDRCLKSIASIANQIVVVDTGSTDETVEIAKKYGALVEEIAWPDDFAAARNFALNLATGDWVLSIDADEWRLPTSIDPILAALHDSSILVLPRLTSPTGRSSFLGVRLFPRIGASWHYPIHEQVIHADKNLVPVRYGPFVLNHESATDLTRKRDRNRKLIAQLAKTEPDLAKVYLALESAAEDPISEKTIAELRDADQQLKDKPSALARKVSMLLATALIHSNQFDQAATVIQSAVDRGLGGLWTSYFVARRSFELGQYNVAFEAALKGLQQHDFDGPVDQMRAELRQIIASGR
ncbi:hypothetical protein BH11ARM1_BH11ARM1_10140 [soil metagenome]